MNLARYFDRVVVINLKRRPDRLARVTAALRRCHWPFLQPMVFAAVDGLVETPPAHWKAGPGAWGCLQSHHRVLRQAIQDGVERLLVLEDDIFFPTGFVKNVRRFLMAVPRDWDQLMLGGQHMNHTGEPALIAPGVVRCTDCERTHCYAIRGEFMRKLCQRWIIGGKFNGSQHCDWIMGRDPEMQFAHKVYAPENFLAGQDRDDKSDIFSTGQPRRIWNPPSPHRSVINLHAPANVVSALRQHGLCTGDGLQRRGDLGEHLTRLFEKTVDDPRQRVRLLREWIILVQWELAAESDMTCTIWHPHATRALVRAASHWLVYEVKAKSVKAALRQLPPKLRVLHARSKADNFWPSAKALAPRKSSRKVPSVRH